MSVITNEYCVCSYIAIALGYFRAFIVYYIYPSISCMLIPLCSLWEGVSLNEVIVCNFKWSNYILSASFNPHILAVLDEAEVAA